VRGPPEPGRHSPAAADADERECHEQQEHLRQKAEEQTATQKADGRLSRFRTRPGQAAATDRAGKPKAALAKLALSVAAARLIG